MPPAKKPRAKAAPKKKVEPKAPEPVQEPAPVEENPLPFRDDSNEREIASSPWAKAVPEPVTHDPVADYHAREAARTAQREEHTARVGGGPPPPSTKVVGDDGLEVFEDDDIDDDEDGDDENELTRDLPTDDYEQAENDHDDQPG